MTLSGLLLVKPPQTGGARKCDLCLTEEMAIMKADLEPLLNMHEEFVSKCRHINKFTLWFFKKKKLNKIYQFIIFKRPLGYFTHLYFYKNYTIQTFNFISSKVVCFKKHLAYQVSKDPQETKYPQPLNVSYRCQTIKFAVGAQQEQ